MCGRGVWCVINVFVNITPRLINFLNRYYPDLVNKHLWIYTWITVVSFFSLIFGQYLYIHLSILLPFLHGQSRQRYSHIFLHTHTLPSTPLRASQNDAWPVMRHVQGPPPKEVWLEEWNTFPGRRPGQENVQVFYDDQRCMYWYDSWIGILL